MVLAGSAEARQIAQMARDAGADARALVSEPPRGPNPMPVPCALHGFADVAGVVEAMRGQEAVLDASHGFDGSMSALGFAAARSLGLPFLIYARPAWEEPRADSRPTVAAAMPLIAAGARVFSATGWASLPEYAGFPGARLLLRQTSRHDRRPTFDFVEPVFGEAPFTVESETALFRALEVDTLICRNLGGRASWPKVAAALSLGVRVILIDRPPLPEGAEVVSEVDRALAWIARQ